MSGPATYASSCQECGWTGTSYRSQAQADYAYRQHSCALQRRRDAARLARVRQRSLIDRTPKPCRHKRAKHVHGTYVCYTLDVCRCRPCVRAAHEYYAGLTRRNAYGRSNLVDAQPIREHVAALQASGLGLKFVAKRSGVAHGALWKLMYGKKHDGVYVPSKRVRRDTADKLLALQPGLSLLADGAKVPGVGTMRRLQALGCLGWSIGRLAVECGLDRQALDRAMHGGDVQVATARAAAAAYERLWDTAAPENDHRERIAASRSRRRAQELGWAPALAWDDDAIDDPAAAPLHRLHDDQRGVDEAAIERRLAGDRVKLTRAERWAVVRRLHAQGMNDCEIGRSTGIHERQVLRDRQDLGLPANAVPFGDRSGRVA